MGADSSMYRGPWRELDWVRFLDWPAYYGETTLAEVAQRVIDENGIQPGDGVGGSSLGGMVAVEVARLVPVSSVVLIGSAMTRAEIHPLLTMAAPLVTLTPLRLAQILAGKSVEGPVGDAFARADPRFVRAMCRALAHWDGAGASSLPCPVYRIHGEHDLVIPCPGDSVQIVPGAGHLIALTHPKECVEFLLRARGED